MLVLSVRETPVGGALGVASVSSVGDYCPVAEMHTVQGSSKISLTHLPFLLLCSVPAMLFMNLKPHPHSAFSSPSRIARCTQSAEKIHRLMQDTNLLYRTATNDASASCKEVCARPCRPPCLVTLGKRRPVSPLFSVECCCLRGRSVSCQIRSVSSNEPIISDSHERPIHHATTCMRWPRVSQMSLFVHTYALTRRIPYFRCWHRGPRLPGSLTCPGRASGRGCLWRWRALPCS